jgi:hypothetical protein
MVDLLVYGHYFWYSNVAFRIFMVPFVADHNDNNF